DRRLLQHAGRVTVGVTLDTPADRVGCVGGNAGQFEGPAVDPGPVVVAVMEEHSAVADHTVEQVAGWLSAGKGVQTPAAAPDPVHRGVFAGVRVDLGQISRHRVLAAEVARAEFEAAPDRVYVGILKARHEPAAGQVDDLGSGADQVVDRADGHDDP